MRNLPISYIEGEEGEFVVLLTARQKKKTLAFIEDSLKQADLLGFDPTAPIKDQDPEAVRAFYRAEQAKADLAHDDVIRTQHEKAVKTAVFQVKDPLSEHQEEIEAAMKDEEGNVKWDQAKAEDLAYKLLDPQIVSGYEGTTPLEMKAVLRDACYGFIFPNLPESRRFFSMTAPAG